MVKYPTCPTKIRQTASPTIASITVVGAIGTPITKKLKPTASKRMAERNAFAAERKISNSCAWTTWTVKVRSTAEKCRKVVSALAAESTLVAGLKLTDIPLDSVCFATTVIVLADFLATALTSVSA